MSAPSPVPSSRDVTQTEGRVEPDTWYAATAAGADFRSHRLPSKQVDGGHWKSVEALCGEKRQRWRPVEDFADPDVFHPCTTCQSLTDDAP